MSTSAVNAAGATVKVTLERIRVETSNPFSQPSVFDTGSANGGASGPAAQMEKLSAQMFMPLVGQSVTISIQQDGVVRAFTGAVALMQGMRANSWMHAGMNKLMGGALNAAFTDIQGRSTFQNFDILPDKSVKVGETWRREGTIPLIAGLPGEPGAVAQSTVANVLGPATVSSSFTVLAIEQVAGRAMVRVAVNRTIKMNPNPMVSTTTMADTVARGELLFDATLGRLERYHEEFMLNTQTELPGSGGAARRVESSILSKVTVELLADPARSSSFPSFVL